MTRRRARRELTTFVGTNGLATFTTLGACLRRGEAEGRELLERAHVHEALEELGLYLGCVLAELDGAAATLRRLQGMTDAIAAEARRKRHVGLD